MQVARNLTDKGDGFLRGVRYPILDRDLLVHQAVQSDVEGRWRDSAAAPCVCVRISDAHAERLVPSVKSKRLRKLVPLSEGPLRHSIREYTQALSA